MSPSPSLSSQLKLISLVVGHCLYTLVSSVTIVYLVLIVYQAWRTRCGMLLNATFVCANKNQVNYNCLLHSTIALSAQG